jgi:hypothetical protein
MKSGSSSSPRGLGTTLVEVAEVVLLDAVSADAAPGVLRRIFRLLDDAGDDVPLLLNDGAVLGVFRLSDEKPASPLRESPQVVLVVEVVAVQDEAAGVHVGPRREERVRGAALQLLKHVSKVDSTEGIAEPTFDLLPQETHDQEDFVHEPIELTELVLEERPIPDRHQGLRSRRGQRVSAGRSTRGHDDRLHRRRW